MIPALVIIAVYILGPALVLIWAVKRYKSGVKPDLPEVVAVIVAIVLIGLLIWNYSGTVTDTDSDDSQAVVTELVSRYAFPVKARFQDRPAVDAEARGRKIVVRIYGVLESTEQEKIGDLARKLRKEIASKPIVVEFYKKEVWEENSDGSRQPLRHKEQLLRTIRAE